MIANQRKKAFIVVNNKIIKTTVNQLIETNFSDISKHEESPLFLKTLFSSFQNHDYNIEFLTWEDFEDLNIIKDDIIIIPPWYITGNRYLMTNKKLNQDLVNIIGGVQDKLCHIITLTRSNSCWGELTDLFYKGNKNGFIRSEIQTIRVKQYHPELTKGLQEIIKSSQFMNDFFGRIIGDGNPFITLISKIPQSLPSTEFNLFGFMKFSSGSYLFNIDIANSGTFYSHQKLFSQILNNVINYLNK